MLSITNTTRSDHLLHRLKHKHSGKSGTLLQKAPIVTEHFTHAIKSKLYLKQHNMGSNSACAFKQSLNSGQQNAKHSFQNEQDQP